MFTSVDKMETRSTRTQFLLVLSFLGVVFFFGAVTTSFAAAPLIFHSTESAGPGNVVQLQGANFGASPMVSIQHVTGSEGVLAPAQQLSVISKSDTSVSAKIPATFPKGLYALWVSNGDLSEPVMVNRARVNQLEFPEVDQGRTFRLFGRNLSLSGFTPSVRFVDQASGQSLSGEVQSAAGNDGYVYRVKAPDKLEVGHSYTIYFKNGAGGKWGEAAAADPLPVRSGGTDSFSLGVPWGADFAPFAAKVYNVKNAPFNAKGDGTTDDKTAIQSAIDSASAAGGGVVYFPAGTYNIVSFANGIGLNMKSQVVLKGYSRTGTTLKFSPASNPLTQYRRDMIWWENGVTVSGLTQLTVFNNSTYQLSVSNTFGANTSKVFIKNVTINLNMSGTALAFEGNRYLLDNVTVCNPRMDGNTLMLSQPGSLLRTSHYAIVRNSKFPNITQRLEAGVDTLIENNIFTYNGTYQADLTKPPGSSSYEQNSIEIRDKTVMLNNTFNNAGDPFVPHNDGETILNQMTALNDANQPQQDLGTAASAASATLTDTSKDWSTLNWAGFIVAITDGPGTGQWRKIVSNTKDTVTVNQPWQVIPTNASRYTLMRFGVQTVLIKGNVLENKERGIWIYSGGQDIAIVNNSLTDAGGIWVRSEERTPWSYANPPIQTTNIFQMAWDVLVANNKVTRTANPNNTTRPAHITASVYHQTTDVRGSGILGVEMRGNVISAIPGPELRYPDLPILRDGYTAAASYTGDDKFGSPDWSKASLRGVIFDDNSASDVNTAYHVSSGAYQTHIANSNETRVSQKLQDMGTYDGQLLNGAAWTAASDVHLGKALQLDGVTNRVALGLNLGPTRSSHLSVLARGPVFTLEARVKTTANSVQAILDLANGPSTEPQWMVSGGRLTLRANNTFFDDYMDPSRVVNNGDWHHVAVSYDGTTLRFYVDGKLGASHPVNLVPFNFTNGFWSAGAWLGSSWDVRATGEVTWPFNGALDEVRIWNIARSADEIKDNANSELTGLETGLVNYWRFNEGTGNFAVDTAFRPSVDTSLGAP